MTRRRRSRLGILGDRATFAGALALAACAAACGGSTGPEVDDACGQNDRPTCNGDGEVLQCDAQAKRWKLHVPDPNGTRCSCPGGNGPGHASCVSAGFVGVARSDRPRPRGVSPRARRARA